MIRAILKFIVFVFAANAVMMALDWIRFHCFQSGFALLERHAGYWALAVVCFEIFFILVAVYKLTGWPIFYRWLMASSWLLSSYLLMAYLGRTLSADPKRVHSLESFYSWQTATLLHAQQIHAVRALPILTLILAGLMVGLMEKLKRVEASRELQPEPSGDCPHCIDRK